MVELEIDGRKVEVPEGSMVMDAARKLDVFVPHFCYHPKLSIAANCRMCLVDVEKAPKPLPACATPVAKGMVVRTRSERALQAQKGVMEFLLINHPLDCPICDQGGECQLQDLAVGYGGSTSRYTEEKRVVFHKNAGPLVGMEEMTRCIHCTRCVRFGQEVAGLMELGMAHRGEHSEITTFLEGSIESELSGNMIDLCPVGALTSKPFRFAARPWELARRASISPHDSIGANLVLQVKGSSVVRVVPDNNEAVNECWLSDRDRFSYEGLRSADRLVAPMVRDQGRWREVDWPTALDFAVNGLQRVIDVEGPRALGSLASPMSTNEELYLLQRLVRALGSENIDTRLRRSDRAAQATVPSLGMPLAEVAQLQSALVIGSFLRKDHPLLAARLRRAARAGAQVSVLHASSDDALMPLHAAIAAAPGAWLGELAAVAAAVADAAGVERPSALRAVEVSQTARAVAASLHGRKQAVVWLGNAAAQHPQAAQLETLARWIAQTAGARFGYTVEAGNTVGAHLVRALPGSGGADVPAMLRKAPSAMLLLGIEPELDLYDGAAAADALRASAFVVALSAYRSAELEEYAQVLLPIAPFSETGGSLFNCEGRLQSFQQVVPSLGASRPAWKVLRVLANQFGLPGFEYDTAESVREAALQGLDVAAALALPEVQLPQRLDLPQGASEQGYERVADVPIYSSDPIVRRSPSLQLTVDGQRAAQVGLATDIWQALGLQPGAAVRVEQGDAAVELPARLDASLASGVVRVAAAQPATRALGPMFGRVRVLKV